MLFSCVEEGRFEHITDDASVKIIVQNALQGNKDLHIYFVINEGDGVDAVSQGVEGIENECRSKGKNIVETPEGSEQDDDNDDSECMDETEEEEGTESDGVEGESSCEDDGINVDVKKRDIYLTKNCKERVYARCKGEGCEWRVHANKVLDEPSFQIMRYNKTHTCPEAYHINNKRSKWLCVRYGYQFKTNPKKKMADFKTELMYELGVNITDHQAYKAKKMALVDTTGNSDFQYSLVWDYA
ncbi:hypothetical protein ACS0TY_022488 [Phlomoides rotata]